MLRTREEPDFYYRWRLDDCGRRTREWVGAPPPYSLDDPGPVQPYAEHAHAYRRAGWGHPLPLPPGQKFPPPVGFTGYGRTSVTDADIEEWVDARPGANVALAMDRSVVAHGHRWAMVAIDCDDYRKGAVVKSGATTLAVLERRVRTEFPPTLKMTSRGPGASGKFCYLVPVAATLITALPGVEIIQWFHRYAVAPPSTNPHSRGSRFVWRIGARPRDGADGWPVVGTPSPSDAAVLPAELLGALYAPTTRTVPAEVSDGEHQVFLDAMPAGRPCRAVRERFHAAVVDLHAPGIGRWETTSKHVMALLRYAERRHTGVPGALTALRGRYVAAVADRASERVANGEFDRMLRPEALGLIKADPTPDDERICLCPEGIAALLDAVDDPDDPEIRTSLAAMLGVTS